MSVTIDKETIYALGEVFVTMFIVMFIVTTMFHAVKPIFRATEI